MDWQDRSPGASHVVAEHIGLTVIKDVTATNGSVAAAIAGDRQAMAALWHENRRWVAAVILAHKAAHDPLEDLLQDVAMTFVSKLSTVRDPRHMRAWLRTVAVNAARASARSGNARPWHRATGRVPAELAAPDPDRVVDEEARRLLQVARSLPQAYREPLLLRALHGMRGRHISRLLGVPEATVETRIARARRMVRERMEGEAAVTAGDERNQP
jgi:RNA polymerase sigma-70 factor (ECF subfamily)